MFRDTATAVEVNSNSPLAIRGGALRYKPEGAGSIPDVLTEMFH
jgi:hypothetical protein